MAQNESFALGTVAERAELSRAPQSPEAYEARVQTVKKSQKECESFWERLVRESEQADLAIISKTKLADSAGAPSNVRPDGAAALGACVGVGAVDAIEPEPSSGSDSSIDFDSESNPAIELSFEEKYEALMGVVSNKPTHREILIRVLSFCVEEKEFGVVEDAIQAYPEYPAAGQNPYRLIKYLIDGYGLDCLEIDSEGAVITPERKAELTEDELDDLIACFHLKTTEVGKKLSEDLSPHRRLTDLFSLFSDRRQFYTDLLSFCKEPRRFKDIEQLFAGRDLSGLQTLHPESGLAIKPTVFVDNMEKAGAIVWKKDGWILTKEGEAFLEAIAHGSMK